jgi:hypothetical protein
MVRARIELGLAGVLLLGDGQQSRAREAQAIPLHFVAIKPDTSIGGQLAGSIRLVPDSVVVQVSYDNPCQVPLPQGVVTQRHDSILARVTISEVPDSIACPGWYRPMLYEARAPRSHSARQAVLRIFGSRSGREYTVQGRSEP